MKSKFLYTLLTLVLFISFSCEEEGTRAKLKPEVTPNTIQPTGSTSYELLFEDADSDFDPLEWSAPDFGFQASVSYTVEVAKEGSSFVNLFELATTTTPSVTVLVKELNAALLALGLEPGEPADIEIRIKSVINADVEPVYSVTLPLTVTPYATTFPPIYIIGDAQGWDTSKALVLEATGPGQYEGIGAFQEDGKFRFFDNLNWEQPQWGYSYFSSGTIPAILTNPGDNDSNFMFDGPSGYYEIKVNLNTKVISVTAASAPTLFIIGDAQSWNINNALEMKSLGEGKYEVIGQFQNNGKFRFFVSPDWNAEQYRFSYFTTTDSELANGNDNDSNFLFTATTGIYKATVSLNDKTVTIEEAEEPTLYIIGQDQGWNLDNAFKLTWLGGGKYSGSTKFTNNATFRLFDSPSWSQGWGNYPYFATEGSVTGPLENANDNDSNFRFNGTTGTFTFNVDLYNLSVEME